MGDALPIVNLGAGRTARMVSAGGAHTCALLDDMTLKCWGSNGNGQLGVGDGRDRGDVPGSMGDALPAVKLGTGRTARSLVTGTANTCAILDDGGLKCWGAGNQGQLGTGGTLPLGLAPDQMGDALPFVVLAGTSP
jgi:E3 ubiquitin-protein ligase HERC3